MGNAKKHLTNVEIVKIHNWLLVNHVAMKISHRADRIAKIAADLSIVCTDANLSGLEKEFGFTDWERPRVEKAEGSGHKVDRVALLARALEKLCEDLGAKPPEYVSAIRRKASADEIESALSRAASRAN
jgi:hypothetical protein